MDNFHGIIIAIMLLVIAIVVPVVIYTQQKPKVVVCESDDESDHDSDDEEIAHLKRKLDLHDYMAQRQAYINAVNKSRINSIFDARRHYRRRHRKHKD